MIKQTESTWRDVPRIVANVKDVARRKRHTRSLLAFCVCYLHYRFSSTPGERRLNAVREYEKAILTDRLYYVPNLGRGEGRTTLCIGAVLFKLVTSKNAVVRIVSSSNMSAEHIVGHIHRELATNDLLIEDFPEICNSILGTGPIATKFTVQIPALYEDGEQVAGGSVVSAFNSFQEMYRNTLGSGQEGTVLIDP